MPGTVALSDFAPVAVAGNYSPIFDAAAGRSGVYIIADAATSRALYVGESHTGRLAETAKRHFRRWTPQNDPQGRRRGGTTYDRSRTLICFGVCNAEDAAAAQFALIQTLQPRDNDIDGRTLTDDDDTAGGLPV